MGLLQRQRVYRCVVYRVSMHSSLASSSTLCTIFCRPHGLPHAHSTHDTRSRCLSGMAHARACVCVCVCERARVHCCTTCAQTALLAPLSCACTHVHTHTHTHTHTRTHARTHRKESLGARRVNGSSLWLCMCAAQVGDHMSSFGGVQLQPGVTSGAGRGAALLPAVARELSENENRPVPTVLLRQGQQVTLSLTPRKWEGRGLLGCHLTPL